MKSIIFWDVMHVVASQQTTRRHIPEDDTLQCVFYFYGRNNLELLSWTQDLLSINCYKQPTWLVEGIMRLSGIVLCTFNTFHVGFYFTTPSSVSAF
jgi:hypothetical protein